MARYQFTRIPNNEEGRELVRLMRKYLNGDQYTLRARGQGLKEGRNWRHFQYGAGLKDSSHIRIYIDPIKGEVKQTNAVISATFDAVQEALREGEHLSIENLFHRLIFATPNGAADALQVMRDWADFE